MISIIILIVIGKIYKIKIWPIMTILVISAVIPTIIDIINKIIFKKDGEKKQNTFTKVITGLKGSFLRGIINIAVLPDKAYMSLNAGIKSIYRMTKSKKNLLEWTTSEEAEKMAKKDLKSYYKSMAINVIAGVLGFTILFMYKTKVVSIFIFTISLLWILSPIIMWKISKENKEENKFERLNEDEKKYILEIGEKTWKFFKENINEKGNFLPPDNYQEERKEKIALRTSPTNIGLGILAVISSYDLGYETLEETLNLLEKMINTIIALPKWNGHLYNWYNITNLKPLTPRYVSSVDSGNFIGYLYVVKQFYNQLENKEKYKNIINEIDKIINDSDFRKLYDEKNRLFSIGFNVEENKLTESYYDLLASEARQASLVAIAKKDIPPKHWYNLSRTLTILNKYKGLISWSGTAFEYLMPNINIPNLPSSLLDESCKFMIMSQKEYTKKLNIPWGISESAFNLKDLSNNYQYKAFGIPWLRFKKRFRRRTCSF